MSEIDKIKEEIGWLKIVFALLVAVDVSIIGWAVQNFTQTSITLLFLGAVVVVLVTTAIIFVNRVAYRKIDELGEL